jgi:hypothetical protein
MITSSMSMMNIPINAVALVGKEKSISLRCGILDVCLRYSTVHTKHHVNGTNSSFIYIFFFSSGRSCTILNSSSNNSFVCCDTTTSCLVVNIQ